MTTQTKNTPQGSDRTAHKLPKNEKIKLIKGISGVLHSPSIIEGETSSTGKTIKVEISRGRTYQLDTEKILTGTLEARGGTTFQLYTPEKYQRKQEANYGPGPQSGANQITDSQDLPEATHNPVEEITAGGDR